jgi:hypothetical protein
VKFLTIAVNSQSWERNAPIEHAGTPNKRIVVCFASLPSVRAAAPRLPEGETGGCHSLPNRAAQICSDAIGFSHRFTWMKREGMTWAS